MEYPQPALTDEERKAPDIVSRLRQTRADMIGTDDERHYWDVHDAANEIERLRLTAEEREAIVWCLEMVHGNATECDERSLTLRDLLEKTK